MSWLDKVTGIAQKTWNTVRAVGPFLLSQSDKASEAFKRHLGRVAEAEALKDLLKNEVKLRASLRSKLFERYLGASPEERVRIEQDIEYVDGITRQLNIAAKSLSYGTEEAAPPPNDEKPKAIQDHWLDHFNELARKRNEEWRNELLARALARETERPGTVSPRALWLIGNMEHSLFTALSDLLDLCIWTHPEGSPFLPNSRVQALERKSHGTEQAPPRAVGQLLFQLADIGVLADFLTAARQIKVGQALIVKYEQNHHVILAKQDFEIRGVIFTPLGESIARFYEPRWNPTGNTILAEWIASLTPDIATVQILKMERPKSGA